MWPITPIMDKTINQSAGPKVSQIANLFQRRPIEIDSTMQSDHQLKDVQQHQQQHQHQPQQPSATVVRTESHSTRFNNARALFEKLGVENRAPRPAALSLKMSNSSSREDNLGDLSPDRDNMRTPSPKRTKYPIGNNNNNIVNGGVPKRDPTKIHNTSRLKSDKPEKPEKPERKFNSKELIEKQKNWTSHFTKARTTRFNSDPNRCDIIRSVPGTVFYPSPVSGGGSIDNSHSTSQQQPNSLESTRYHSSSKSVDYESTSSSVSPHRNSPPSPPIRQHLPPEIKPRHTKFPSSICSSPTKPPPPIPTNKPQIVSPIKSTYIDHQIVFKSTTNSSTTTNKQQHDDVPEKRKRSIDLIEDTNDICPPVEYAQVKKHSITATDASVGSSPAHGVSSSPSPAPSASSGPSSPIHTEDEKQENESTEKSEKPLSPLPPEPFEREYFFNFLFFVFYFRDKNVWNEDNFFLISSSYKIWVSWRAIMAFI